MVEISRLKEIVRLYTEMKWHYSEAPDPQKDITAYALFIRWICKNLIQQMGILFQKDSHLLLCLAHILSKFNVQWHLIWCALPDSGAGNWEPAPARSRFDLRRVLPARQALRQRLAESTDARAEAAATECSLGGYYSTTVRHRQPEKQVFRVFLEMRQAPRWKWRGHH